jgi:hypothetical protein
MSKRFTDKDIWKKKWFRKLTPAEKCAWRYITDMCDNVGVWDVDTELAEIFIGEEIDWKEFREKTNGNIVVLQNEKWWLVDFVTFQYGELHEDVNDKARQSYINLLKKHGLWEQYLGVSKGLNRGLQGPQEKEKDKEKDKEKEYTEEFEKFWSLYPRKVNKRGAYKAYKAREKEGEDMQKILSHLRNYAELMEGKDEQYIMHASTFLGPNKRYEDYSARASPYCEKCGAKLIDGRCKRCESV